jgi:tRNA G18 (ribose-2'-O)-methylase SpoU
VAAAFGVDAVLLDGSSGDPFYRKAVRTSMGAVLAMPSVRVPDLPVVLETCRAAGFAVLALTPRAGAVPVTGLALRPHQPILLLVGSEGSGLSDRALEAADVLVRIPMADAVDSLNVTVAAGIALSHLSSARPGDPHVTQTPLRP